MSLQSHGLLGRQFSLAELWPTWSAFSRRFPEMSLCSSLGFWTKLDGRATVVKFLRYFSPPFCSLVGWRSDLCPRGKTSGEEESESRILILLLPVLLGLIIVIDL